MNGQLVNPTTLRNVVYSNQNVQQPTDGNNGQVLYYDNGAPTSSENLNFDGDELNIDGGLFATNPAKVNGWITSGGTNPVGATSLYPPVTYGASRSGSSIGWNLAIGYGEMVFMNNYLSSNGGFYFHQRTGQETSSVLLAASLEIAPPYTMAGNTYVSNLHTNGITRFMPPGPQVFPIGNSRSYNIEQRVYCGTFGPGQSDQLQLRLTEGGQLSIFITAVGTESNATYNGYAFRGSNTPGAGYLVTAPLPPTTGAVRISFGANTEGAWNIYFSNTSGVNAVWQVTHMANPLIV